MCINSVDALTVVLRCSTSSAAAAAKGLVTTKDHTAGIEEAAEEINGDEHEQNDANYNASNGACSESRSRTFHFRSYNKNKEITVL